MAISMNSFWKKSEDLMNDMVETATKKLEDVKQTIEPEQWIWVDGYKGTDIAMCCRDMQYEIGKRYDMDDGEIIQECESGYHLCLHLRDVFTYYPIGCGHRFFKVRALVRKSEFEAYGKSGNVNAYFAFPTNYKDKLVSKSIEFVKELSMDEILENSYASKWPEEFKKKALQYGLDEARYMMDVKELEGYGYSNAFANYLARCGKSDIAKAVGSQIDLSMDVKVMTIFSK